MSTSRSKYYQGYRAKQILQMINEEETDEEEDPPKRTTKCEFKSSRRKNYHDIDKKTYSTPPKHKKIEPSGIHTTEFQDCRPQTHDSGKSTIPVSVNNENLKPKKHRLGKSKNDGKEYSKYPLTPSKCKKVEKQVPDTHMADSLGGQPDNSGIQVLDAHMADSLGGQPDNSGIQVPDAHMADSLGGQPDNSGIQVLEPPVVIDSGKGMSKVKTLGSINQKKCTMKVRSLSLSDLTEDTQLQKTIRRYTSVPAVLNLEVDPTIFLIEDKIYEDVENIASSSISPNKILNERSTDSNLESIDTENEPDNSGIKTLDPLGMIGSGKKMSEVNIIDSINQKICTKSKDSIADTNMKVKSLSLSDLTQDVQLQKAIRRCKSVPAALNLEPTIFLMNDETYEDDEYIPPNNILNESSTDSNLEITDNENEYGNPNEGRKRQRKANPKNWKKNVTKQKRMKGEDYLGYQRPKGAKATHNRMRLAKQLGDPCRSVYCRKSKFRGCHRFDEETRQKIHNHYWKNLNWDQRKIYVVGLVTRVPKAVKKTSQPESRREGTLKYCLPLTETSTEKIQVCKEMFLSTLSMKSFTVQSWVRKADFGMVINQEDRQKTQWKKPTTSEQVARKMAQLEEFLDQIPKLPSHYARADTSKLFIEPSFKTLVELYNAYKTICDEKQIDPVCRYTFEKRFHEKNLAIYTLKKDKCDVCAGYEAGNIEEADYQIHIIKKNRARKEKDADKKKAADNEITLLTMDLEAVKVCPCLTASSLYFKTKLTCHNFTVFNLKSRHCTCYWFDETASDLKSSTFASFLIDYLERHCLPLNKPIIIYSDGCTYQNRNVILANALLNFSKQHGVTITQKYLEVGHTQMECDSIHSAIERKLKNREIYLPSDYIKVTKEARSKDPYEVVQADFEFFKDYSCTKTWVYKSIRPGRKAGDPQVVDIRAILYNPDSTIKIKLDFDADWMDLPQRQNSIIRQVPYQRLHAEQLPIASTKYNHLQQLKAVIPKDCHSFYNNLPKQG